MNSGVCRKCGCTIERACLRGCAWVDSAETLCTACLPKLTTDELEPLAITAMTQLERTTVDVQFSGLAVFRLIGLLQLCTRHPGLRSVRSPSYLFAEQLIADLTTLFAGDHVMLEAIRRGSESMNDVPIVPEPAKSNLILPNET